MKDEKLIIAKLIIVKREARRSAKAIKQLIKGLKRLRKVFKKTFNDMGIE